MRWGFANAMRMEQFSQLGRTFGRHRHGAFGVDKLFFIVVAQAQLFGTLDHSDEAGDHFAAGHHFVLLEGGAIDFITY